MPEKESTLCFTGHRRYSGGAEDEARLVAALDEAYADGYRTFISGMAEGFDLVAAAAVVRLRERRPDVMLVAALPFRGQAAGFGAADKQLHDNLLAAADRIEVLAERYDHGCYYRRDDWMTDHSSRVVCWYDGSPSGTRYTVRSALARNLVVVNIFRTPGSLF